MNTKYNPNLALTALLGWALGLTIAPIAIAQNPADLVPPAPDVYATGNQLNPTLNNPAPQSETLNAQNTPGYRVFIPGDHPIILERAKAIEPTAFIQMLNGQSVIQIGLYGTEELAMKQVAKFQAQGMPVKLLATNQSEVPAPLPVSTIPPAPTYSTSYQPPSIPSYPGQNQIVNTVSPGYYVIIPTAIGDANYIRSQLNQLGIPPQYIFLRDRPFGVHYAVGTFSKRGEAERLSTLVRDRTKFDARVYHER